MVHVLPSKMAVVKPRVLRRHAGSTMLAEPAIMYRRPRRRFVPAVRPLVVDGEWATAIMAPPIKAFIRGCTPLVVEKVLREEKEMEAPWRRPEKEAIMVGD